MPDSAREEAVLPDYAGGSIVNLMASLASSLGGETGQPHLRALPPGALDPRRHLVLLVIDGLGDTFLARHGGGVLRRERIGRMTSVFPSTTASAVTTFLTGDPPARHGVTGWFMYARELGTVISPLLSRPRFGGEQLGRSGVNLMRLYGARPFADRLRAETHMVMPVNIARSEFNTVFAGSTSVHPYTGMNELLATVVALVRGAHPRRYVYAYWPRLDELAHRHGVEATETVAHLNEIEDQIGRLLRDLRGCPVTLVITADHGFVNADPAQAIELEAHPQLKQRLAVPLCGERRAAFCYLRAPAGGFAQVLEAAADDLIRPVSRQHVLEQGYLGPGPVHPELSSRIGDWCLLTRQRATILDRVPGERPHPMIGVHGGLSPQEMYVPLILAQP